MKPEADMCFDAYLEGESFDPAQLPSPVDLRSASPNELALAWQKQWQAGQEIRIRFLDGDSRLHARVEAHARQWLDHANLLFNFGNHSSAEVRISFKGHGFWSLVGTDAMQRPDPIPTMQLGGLTADSNETTLRRAVLHEFGHTIGCVHEQASPAIAIPWDEEKVYAYYWRMQRWDRETTYNNVLYRYSPAMARFTDHDPRSIMQYPVLKELTVGGFEIGWNTELSDLDRSFIAKMYPRKSD
jgi:hypothetical protein